MGLWTRTTSTLESTIGAIGTTADTITDGIEMLAAEVKLARFKQTRTHTIERKAYTERAVSSAADQQRDFNARLAAKYAADPLAAAEYDAIRAEYAKLFATEE